MVQGQVFAATFLLILKMMMMMILHAWTTLLVFSECLYPPWACLHVTTEWPIVRCIVDLVFGAAASWRWGTIGYTRKDRPPALRCISYRPQFFIKFPNQSWLPLQWSWLTSTTRLIIFLLVVDIIALISSRSDFALTSTECLLRWRFYWGTSRLPDYLGIDLSFKVGNSIDTRPSIRSRWWQMWWLLAWFIDFHFTRSVNK